MAKNQKYLRIFLGLFSVVFFALFRNSDIDYKNDQWDIHIDTALLDTEFAENFSSQLPVLYIETEDSMGHILLLILKLKI